jgi:hypothetical protein
LETIGSHNSGAPRSGIERGSIEALRKSLGVEDFDRAQEQLAKWVTLISP